MKLPGAVSMSTNDAEAVRALVSRARKLELIDSWAMSEAHIILSKDAVTYRICFTDAVRFLRSLIRDPGGRGRMTDAA